MTAVVRPATTNWQEKFLELIPDIQNFARYAFRKLPPDHREEAISEIIARTCVAFARLAERGLLEKAYATVLARFAVAQYADGRRTGTTTNTRDLTSPSCAKKHAVRVDSLHRFDASQQEWREVVVEDSSAGPAETAAFRIDFETWLESLPPNKQEFVTQLGKGETPSEVAQKHKLSRGRVSQIRTELAQSWEAWQHDDTNSTSTQPKERHACATSCRLVSEDRRTKLRESGSLGEHDHRTRTGLHRESQ